MSNEQEVRLAEFVTRVCELTHAVSSVAGTDVTMRVFDSAQKLLNSLKGEPPKDK